MLPTCPSVTACVPYFRGKRHIFRAIQSLLAQTHRDLIVIVVNDGDKDPPWNELASIDDRRLIRFSLTRNHGGPFFANAVVAEAASSPWFLVQEQDDWSTPDRVARLLQLAVSNGADAAISAHYFHQQQKDGRCTPIGVRWQHTGRLICPEHRVSRGCQRCFVDTGLTTECRHRAPHSGLFRSSALRRIGGYYAGLRLHYDTLLMNLLLMTGRLAHTQAMLYHRLLSPNSLTQARETTFSSAASRAERRTMAALYERAFTAYQLYVQGQLSSEGLGRTIRRCCHGNIPPIERQELAFETNRLRGWLRAQHSPSNSRARE